MGDSGRFQSEDTVNVAIPRNSRDRLVSLTPPDTASGRSYKRRIMEHGCLPHVHMQPTKRASTWQYHERLAVGKKTNECGESIVVSMQEDHTKN